MTNQNPYNKTNLPDTEFDATIKEFCRDHIIGNVSSLVEYVLSCSQSSCDDLPEPPFSHEDLVNSEPYGMYNGEKVSYEYVEELKEEAEEQEDYDTIDLLDGVEFDCEPLDEVLEWVQVTSYLASKLISYGELVLDGEYWGRTEYGLGYSDSSVIQKIVSDLENQYRDLVQTIQQ